jgi:ATP-dependent protease ClpP protease subunit
MTAEQAKAYGIVDEIITKHRFRPEDVKPIH